MKKNNSIWVFSGIGGRFPSGVFLDLELAKVWIQKYQLTGVLTKYPINQGVYDWTIENKYFNITKEKHKTSDFIGKFSSAHQEHIHFENGKYK